MDNLILHATKLNEDFECNNFELKFFLKNLKKDFTCRNKN